MKKVFMAEVPEELKILRSTSAEVVFPDPELKQLVIDMKATMKAYRGIGLSAPQIGVLKRIMIAEYSDGKHTVPFTTLVNPEVTWSSKKEVSDEEGCLSFPDLFGMVKRPEKIEYQGYDLEGNKITGKTGGLLARIIQHEIDHLNGVLFIDRAEGDLYTYEKEEDTKEI